MKGMNGHIIDGTPICVDYWQWTPKKQYVHFLTHLHADHTVGLKSSFRERIYTSPFNAWLLERWFKIDLQLIVPLAVGDSHVICDENTDVQFTVTLIDANHCPGSTMFLFQGPFGNILYTGDFRYSPDMLEHPMMKSVIENEVVHKLYLDNTFAAEHCEFPARSEALEALMTLISNHQDQYVILGARKLGKEEVFKSVALYLKENILVSEERLKILAYLKYPNVFTTNGKETRIMVKEMHQITSSFLHRLQEEKGPVLTVLLTALYNINPSNGRGVSKLPSKVPGVHHIPYSDHCSHSELLTFVSKVRPHRIYPIVLTSSTKTSNSDGGSDIDLNNYSYHLKNLSDSSIIPSSILNLCRQPEPNLYDISILESKTKQDYKDDLSQQTENEITSTFSEICVSDTIKHEVYRCLRSSNHSQDLDSPKIVSLRADTTTTSIGDEYNTAPDEDINQLNVASNIASVQPKLGTSDAKTNSVGDEYYSMPDEDMNQQSSASSIVCGQSKLGTAEKELGDDIVDKLVHSNVNIFPSDIIESDASVQQQGFSCIDVTSDIQPQLNLYTILSGINASDVQCSKQIKDCSPSTESISLIMDCMQGPSSPALKGDERRIDSLKKCSQIDFAYNDEESLSSTVKGNEITSFPSLISLNNQVDKEVNEGRILGKPDITECNASSCNQILPTSIITSEDLMDLLGTSYIDEQSEFNESDLNKVNTIDDMHYTQNGGLLPSPESDSLIKDYMQSSPSSDLIVVRQQARLTSSTYSDEENPSTTIKDNEILFSPSVISSSKQKKEKNDFTYRLGNQREEKATTSVNSSKNLSSLTSVSKCKLLNVDSTDISIIVDYTEEMTTPVGSNVNACDESIKPMSECGVQPASFVSNKQRNNELNGNQISITKKVLIPERSVQNSRSSKKEKCLLVNEVQDDYYDELLLPVSSLSHSKPLSSIENKPSLLHKLICVDKNNTDHETVKHSQLVASLDSFYKQIPNIYKSWQQSVKRTQFKSYKCKKAIKNNHKEMWKDYKWKLLFENYNKM